MKRTFLTRALPFEHETSLFILVSAADLFMTYILLWQGAFRESNPIADYFLKQWGAKGLIGFKFAMVAIVCTLAQIIARKKPETARRLLSLATLFMSIVVLYGFALLASYLIGF